MYTVPQNPGERIELDAFLQGGDSSKFVRATIKDSDNNTILSSPVVLQHVGGGRYFDDSRFKPTGSVWILYEVFEDSNFTQKSLEYSEVVQKLIDPPLRNLILEQIRFGETIDAEIKDEDYLLEGILHGESEAVGIVEDDDTLSSTVEGDESVSTSISSGDNISGETT